jgi:hypothetical protein
VVSETVRRFFETGDHDQGGFEVFRLWSPSAAGRERLRAAWEACREELLGSWLKAHPGTRPWAWWELDAPRWTRTFDAYLDGTLPEPRRRLGGIGTPSFEVLAIVPCFAFGLPVTFVDAWSVAYYNGRAKDIHGNPIGTEYQEGHFKGVAIDPADPPRFESEAAYLERHGLLTPAEVRWLAEHPEALEPEVVVAPQ